MGAIIKSCLVGNSIKNTGKECDISMSATSMLIAVPSSLKFTLQDVLDPVAFFTSLFHETKSKRAYPFFGIKAPISTINNNKESDVLVTLDDGTQVLLRYGMYNRMFETIAGGLCYAQALKSLNKSGYNIIEIDQEGKMLVRLNNDGTYSGLITTFMYSPSPTLADLKTTPYKNAFQVSYSPDEFVNNGAVLSGAEQLLSMMGLIDTDVVAGTTNPSTTHIFFGVKTDCAETDLVSSIGNDLATVSNFIVKRKDTGATITPSNAAITNGQIDLTGVYPTGVTLTVTGSVPSVWLANDVEGYDASSSTLEIAIP